MKEKNKPVVQWMWFIDPPSTSPSASLLSHEPCLDFATSQKTEILPGW